MSDEIAFIYLIGPKDGPTKIGHSLDTRARIKQLQRESEQTLLVLGEWPVGAAKALAIERYVHWLLREKHFRGEWFHCGRDEVDAAVEKAIEAPLDRYTLVPPLDSGGRTAEFPDRQMMRFRGGTLDEIDAIVGKGCRSAFIRDAVESELERRDRSAFIRDAVESELERRERKAAKS